MLTEAGTERMAGVWAIAGDPLATDPLTGIANRRRSRLTPLSGAPVLSALLEGSGWQLFDRDTMREQMAVLKQLTSQSRAFRLEAGRDLHERPASLDAMLAQAGALP